MKIKLILSIIGILLITNRTQKSGKLHKLEWLLGTWETQTSKGNLYETWTKKSRTEFQGKSYYLKNKDTLIFESVQLIEKDKKLHYIVSVKNHNHELPVDFVSKEIKDPASLLFENPLHDFPQMITYKKQGKDSLIAEISGTMNGKIARQKFPMRKVK